MQGPKNVSLKYIRPWCLFDLLIKEVGNTAHFNAVQCVIKIQTLNGPIYLDLKSLKFIRCINEKSTTFYLLSGKRKCISNA